MAGFTLKRVSWVDSELFERTQFEFKNVYEYMIKMPKRFLILCIIGYKLLEKEKRITNS